jgi:hypothetical protein
VLSVDPMTWVPEEELYIRCEDTVVITRTGIENFTAAAPLDLDEVEAWMRNGEGCRSSSARNPPGLHRGLRLPR